MAPCWGQEIAEESPSAGSCPAMHDVQSSQSLMPVRLWYFPAAQVTHSACPVLGWWRPAGQAAQGVAGLAENVPAAHGFSFVLLSGQCVPTAQATFWSGVAHTDPLGQSASFTDPSGQNDPARHGATVVEFAQ